jgi:hypothetical protein
MSRQSLTFKVFLEFILGLFRTENLNLCGVTNIRDDFVIIFAETVPETPVE